MRKILETVVSEGGGKSTDRRIPDRRKDSDQPDAAKKCEPLYRSLSDFAPAGDPQVAAMAIIYNPQGIYYGGTIAAPVVRDIFDNILPYLGIEREENP